MSTDEVVIEAPKATIYVERSLQVRQFESLKIGMHFPVDLPLRSAYADEDILDWIKDVDSALKGAYTTVKAHIYEQAGLEFEDKNGILLEKVERAFPGSTEVQPQPAAAPRREPDAPAPGLPTVCPACGGDKLYDNRPKKASGQYKANAPDAKCADKACGKGIWLQKKGS